MYTHTSQKKVPLILNGQLDFFIQKHTQRFKSKNTQTTTHRRSSSMCENKVIKKKTNQKSHAKSNCFLKKLVQSKSLGM